MTGTQSFTDTDFAGAFQYRYQHDVHDADAAHQQGYSGNSAEEKVHAGRAFFERGYDIAHRSYVEVVVIGRADSVTLTQKNRNVFDNLVIIFLIRQLQADARNDGLSLSRLGLAEVLLQGG